MANDFKHAKAVVSYWRSELLKISGEEGAQDLEIIFLCYLVEFKISVDEKNHKEVLMEFIKSYRAQKSPVKRFIT